MALKKITARQRTCCSSIRVSSLFLFFLGLLFSCPCFAQPIQKVDIFLLFDNTSSFSTFAPAVSDIFSGLADGLEARLPGVEFGFGVGRFKDYGGTGWDFCSNQSVHCVDDFSRRVTGRPFYLNQPIITSSNVGGQAQRDALISEALNRGAVGTGGDDPEGHIEALWQIVTGAGFDGNGDGSRNGIDGSQVAGASVTQLTPDESGDVPGFPSLSAGVIASGNLGGAGFRSDALKIVIIATEICPAIAFPAGSAIPSTVNGRYSNELVADFACLTTTPGDDRFGFVSNALSAASNSVPNAVVPKGSATLTETIADLNRADIRVLAMGPGLGPRSFGSGPGHEPSGFLSALSRITGGVDSQGVPLVFDIGAGGAPLQDKLLQALLAVATPNPGCSNQDLTSTFAAIDAATLQQRTLALATAKKTKRKKNAFMKTSLQIELLFSQSKAVTQTYPKQFKVCQNNACPVIDRSAELRSLNNAANGLNSLLNNLINRIKNKKKAKKLRAAATGFRTLITTNIAVIPDHSNECPP